MKQIAIVMLVFMGAIAKAQPLQKLAEEYNPGLVFHSITLAQRTAVLSDLLKSLPYDSTLHLYEKPKPDSMIRFLAKADKKLAGTEKKTAEKTIQQIETITRWQSLLVTLNKSYNVDKENPTTEALYRCKSTRHLFRKYLVTPDIQDWSSLSASEDNDLFRDFILFMIAKTPSRQKIIWKELIAVLLSDSLE